MLKSESPAHLREALANPNPARRPWTTSLAPMYIALFLWVAFYDQLAQRTLSFGGLLPTLGGLVVAGLFGFLLLYYVPAMGGWKTRQSLFVLGSSTFGARGAAVVPGLLMGLVQVIWFAIASHYAIWFNLRGLAETGLISERALEPLVLDGWRLQGGLYLVVALVWVLAFALVSTWFSRWIQAIMMVYPIACAAVLAGAMLWGLPGVRDFRPLPFDPVTAKPVEASEALAFVLTIQLVFGFFATAGAAAADWGAVLPKSSDVRIGGFVCVALAPLILGTLALLAVAGYIGRTADAIAPGPAFESQSWLALQMTGATAGPMIEEARAEVQSVGASNYTFEAVLADGIGGVIGGIMLIVLGLASMATAVYAAFVFGQRFSALSARLPRYGWGLVGALSAYPLLITGWARELETLYTLLGAAFAPVVGAMAAEFLRNRGDWPGPRQGTNRAGLIAWGSGAFVGLLPLIGRGLGWNTLTMVQPASVLAFGVAFGLYLLLAGLGLEPRPFQSSDQSSQDENASATG